MRTHTGETTFKCESCGIDFAHTVVPAMSGHLRFGAKVAPGARAQVAAGYRDITTAKTVVGTLKKWPIKAAGRSPNGPAVTGSTVIATIILIRAVTLGRNHSNVRPVKPLLHSRSYNVQTITEHYLTRDDSSGVNYV